MERGRASAGRQQGQMTKRRKKGRWKGLLLLLLAVFIGYGAWMFLHRPTGYWNIAVFGVDSRDGNTKNALADVQMICSIDRSTGEIRLVSVYRDTYLKINSEGTYHKINEASPSCTPVETERSNCGNTAEQIATIRRTLRNSVGSL